MYFYLHTDRAETETIDFRTACIETWIFILPLLFVGVTPTAPLLAVYPTNLMFQRSTSMENAKLARLPPEIGCLILDYLTVKEVLNFRLISRQCNCLYTDYNSKFKRRLERRTLDLNDISELEEFCQDVTPDFPITSFKFNFNVDYNTYESLFKKFEAIMSSSVLSLNVETLYVCMSASEQRFLSSLANLKRLIIGSILLWDDVFVLANDKNEINVGEFLPEDMLRRLDILEFQSAIDPGHVMFILNKCVNLKELRLGRFHIQFGNMRENVHMYNQKGICKLILSYLRQRRLSNQSNLDLYVGYLALEFAPPDLLEELVLALEESTTTICDIHASTLTDMITVLQRIRQSCHTDFLNRVQSVCGISENLLNLNLLQLKIFKFEIDWDNLKLLASANNIPLVCKFVKLRRIQMKSVIEEYRVNRDPLRYSAFKRLVDMLFGNHQPSVDQVKICFEQTYCTILVDPKSFPERFKNLKHLDLDIPMYSAYEWNSLLFALGKFCKVENLILTMRCNVEDETFLGRHGWPGNITTLTCLQQLKLKLDLPNDEFVTMYLTDRFLERGVSQIPLKCLNLNSRDHGVFEFTQTGILALALGNASKSLRHFHLKYPYSEGSRNPQMLSALRILRQVTSENRSRQNINTNLHEGECNYCQGL